MKIKTTKSISYDDTFILSDSEYDAILQYATNNNDQKSNPYTMIREIVVSLGDLGASYSRGTLKMKVVRSKGTR